MGRIIAIDYGKKRVGIAVTDPLQIVASPLLTVDTDKSIKFLIDYCNKEQVEKIVIGLPYRLNGEETHTTQPALNFGKTVKKNIPSVEVDFEDEQFTSKMAMQAMVKGGMKKKDRRNKENIDKVSAAIILQTYLGIE